MIKYLLLAVLASPVQAQPLKECKQVANEFIDQMEKEGMIPNGVHPFPDGIVITFADKGNTFGKTLLITENKDNYPLKQGARTLSEGACTLQGRNIYFGVAYYADPRSRAEL